MKKILSSLFVVVLVTGLLYLVRVKIAENKILEEEEPLGI